jgi:hypothetical protein
MSAPAKVTRLSERIALPADAEDFCRKNGLERYLEIAVELAEECFQTLAMSLSFVEDPECDDRWITLRLDVRGTVESVVAAKKRYSSEWVSRVLWPERFMIRLSLNIL